MRIRRKLFYILAILVCFILQTTVFQGLAIGSIVPNLLLIATISFGFMQGKVTGIWTGFLCGILKDIFYGNLLGFYALIYLCIGYGKQETGGYSIAVNDLYETANAIYLDTSLIGPKEADGKNGNPSYPYLVIKTPFMDKTVVFD